MRGGGVGRGCEGGGGGGEGTERWRREGERRNIRAGKGMEGQVEGKRNK